MNKSRKQIRNKIHKLEEQYKQQKNQDKKIKETLFHESENLILLGAVASAFFIGWKTGKTPLGKKAFKTAIDYGMPIVARQLINKFMR